ncbi:molybdopterin converting factor subunit 1 [Sediminibacillus massiliensis]|uniref:molybdopterin converting factor subunit 1 n=1 Tax=Sediminibacillus massiliensis TaxID=1926277 RepID=UPI0009885C89|nr:molybdopterin converting factor subunit 1 [Sediminibacillus massiliensis]
MIKILLFAQLQEAAGTDNIELQADGLTVAAVKEKLAKDYQLTTLDQSMAAINEEYAEDDDVIQQGDTVAFIPPVSGG